MIKTTKEFNNEIEYYKDVLRKGYEIEVDKASNKEYAKKYYQQILFLENELTPHYTQLFMELKFVYHHYNSLDNETAFEKTLKHLPQIRKIATTELTKLVSYYKGNINITLSDHYHEVIEDNEVTINDLILHETLALKATDESLMGSLGIGIAGKQLYKEYNSLTEEKKDKKKSNHRHKFTQKQQLLALYFLLEAFGVKNHGSIDLTKLAPLYHLIMGVPFHEFDKIKNNNIYKALRIAPQVVPNEKYLLKNLELIKPYFELSQLKNAVDLIDKQIIICKENIQE